MPHSPVMVGSSFYLNVGRSDASVRRSYLEQTARWTSAVRNAGYRPFLELKHMGLINEERIAELRPLADMFTLHLQYLERQGKPYNTMNLVDPKDRAAIEGDDQISNALSVLSPALISVHCGFSALEIGSAPPDDNNYAVTPVLPRAEVFADISKTLDLAWGCFKTRGYGQKVLIENLDYRPPCGLGYGSAYEHVCEPDFILELLKKDHVGSLLDIAHSVIAGNNLSPGFLPWDFARSLYASGKLVQMHLNSPKMEDGQLLDMHLPFYESDAVVSTLFAILCLHNTDHARTEPLFITVEPSAPVCEKDPETAVYHQGMELLDMLDAVYG